MLGFTPSFKSLFLFLRFQRFPISQHFGGSFGGYIPEHVGMAADQLVRKPIENIVNREPILFAGHLGVEKHLQEQVAEFARKLVPIAVVNCLEYFVCFFERVWLDGIKGLLAVPGTSTRPA